MIVDLQSVKDELGLTSGSDDGELTKKIAAAQAEYVAHVGPMPGSYTVTTTLPYQLPPRVTDVTVPALVTASVPLGLVTGYGSATITYTVGPIPANHQAAIIADLAEWFTRTQRGGGASRPSFGGDAGLEPDTPSRPLVLFPRIRALAPPAFA